MMARPVAFLVGPKLRGRVTRLDLLTQLHQARLLGVQDESLCEDSLRLRSITVVPVRLCEEVEGVGILWIAAQCGDKKTFGQCPTIFLQREDSEIVQNAVVRWVEFQSAAIEIFRLLSVTLCEPEIA